jgi:hypothetical protein
MGWRDRVKKSFAYSADIAEGIQNLKNTEKKEKEGLKTTFRHITQNTQYTQNPKNGPDEGGKSIDPNPDQGQKTRTVKDQSTPNPTPAQNIPAPSPPGMGPEYTCLWDQAWAIADYVDGDTAPIEQRRTRLPELMMLLDRMAEIENTGGLVLDDPQRLVKPKDTGTWTKWEPASGRDPIIPETCPARCKNSGKCYARAYFKGKPGRAVECEPDKCGRIIQLTSDTTGPGKPEQGKNK